MKNTKPSPTQNSYCFDESELHKALKRKDNVDHLGQILKAEVLLKTHKAKNPPKQLPLAKPCHKKDAPSS